MDTNRKIQLVEKLIEKSSEIKNESSSDPTFKSWKNLVERTLSNIFGEKSVEVSQFNALRFAYHGIMLGGTDYSGAHRNAFKRSFETSIQSLNNLLEEFREELAIEVAVTPVNLNDNGSEKIEKIFISHSSTDKEIVEELIEVLESIGLTSTQIFCSSFEGYGIDYGDNFLDKIKDELNNKILVIFLLTHNFYESPVCLCEMGATWIKTNMHIPILVSPFDFKDVKGVIPLTQGFKIDNPHALNQFKQQIEAVFSMEKKLDFSTWERKRDRIIERIKARATK